MAFACEIYLITHSDPVDEEISITALRASGTAAVVVDELRYTTGSLRPSEFLTKGEARPAPGPPIAGNNERRESPPSRPGESPFQRAARELQERKAEQAAERERKRAEDDRRRREGFGVRD